MDIAFVCLCNYRACSHTAPCFCKHCCVRVCRCFFLSSSSLMRDNSISFCMSTGLRPHTHTLVFKLTVAAIGIALRRTSSSTLQSTTNTCSWLRCGLKEGWHKRFLVLTWRLFFLNWTNLSSQGLQSAAMLKKWLICWTRGRTSLLSRNRCSTHRNSSSLPSNEAARQSTMSSWREILPGQSARPRSCTWRHVQSHHGHCQVAFAKHRQNRSNEASKVWSTRHPDQEMEWRWASIYIYISHEWFGRDVERAILLQSIGMMYSGVTRSKWRAPWKYHELCSLICYVRYSIFVRYSSVVCLCQVKFFNKILYYGIHIQVCNIYYAYNMYNISSIRDIYFVFFHESIKHSYHQHFFPYTYIFL